jgi:UDP-2-acetamido-2-deoxy-ribo-hexuluronate aminotransferase
VFVDIERDTCNIDAARVEEAISESTRAIMPVGLYGQPADMDALAAIANRHGVTLIDDAAQAFGSTLGGRAAGSLATLSCTSFFPSKPLGCYGDGGAIFTEDEALARACREIRVHGQSRRYYHTRIGVGGRMDTLQCAVILAKLERFDWEIERRLAIGARYNRLLDDAGIARVVQRAGRTSVFAQYTVLVEARDAISQRLVSEGIPTAVHYPLPLNRQPAFAELCRGTDTPNADWAAERVLSLPMHPDLSEAEQDRVASALIEAVRAGQ